MLEPAETSYFSRPSAGLDPRLFKSGRLDSSIRSAILQLLLNHLNSLYTGAEGWSEAWLAGSGVSYQWAAQREPGDLDCLVGVNFPRFRESNTQYRGLSDKEIAETINEGFRDSLQSKTELFMGTFELTFYVNVSSNIIDIKPYAAYSLTNDDWVVTPSPFGQEVVPEWEKAVERDRMDAIDILTRYTTAKNRYEQATNDALKANARSEMRVAQAQGVTLYEGIHSERANAFSSSGEGYGDFYNYRWQSGKRTGVVQSLRSLKKEMEEQDQEMLSKTYGVELPDANTLIRRAALRKN
jgi:hypothetical protein